MKKRSLISLTTFALTTVCAFGVLAANIFKPNSVNPVFAAGTTEYPYVDPTLPLTDEDKLYATIDNVTKTSSGESFTFSFSANTVLFSADTNKYKEVSGIYVAPSDESYPKNVKLKELTKYEVDINDYENSKYVQRDEKGNILYNEDGTPKLKDGYGFKHLMPTYSACVTLIDVSELAPKKKDPITSIVIPYSITYGSWYKLVINEIGENVISNDGVYGDYGVLKNIVIGDNIETISSGAFPNTPKDFSIKTNIETKPATWSDTFTDAEVQYGYEPTERELSIFDQSEKKDADGNIIYYDNTGLIIDSEGYYLDKEGKRIEVTDSEGKKVYLHYDGTPLTKVAAFEFDYGKTNDLAADKSFVCGCIDLDNDVNLPLLMSYKVTLADGNKETRIFECPLSSPDLYSYDGVGSLAGVYAITKVVDIRLGENESIDYNSVVFYNIFEAKQGQSKSGSYTLLPDVSKAYQAMPSVAISFKNNFEDFFKMEFDSIKTVFGYTSITVKIDCVEGAYAKVKDKKYREKEAGILDGTYKIRYSLRGFKAAHFNVTTKDGEYVEVPFNSSVGGGIPGELDYYVFTKEKGNTFTFLLQDGCISKGFNANNIAKIEVCGFNVTLDICPTKKGTTQVVSQSAVSFRFGALDLLPKDTSNIGSFNGNLFVILFFVIFVVAYALGTGGYYIYARHAFKNDEFRRMNTKAYVKRISVGFIGATFIAGAIAFIILRFSLISPTIAVFNPMDPLVIVFGVGGLISLGFFIKFLVVEIKQEKTRRRNIKLRLGEEAADDGTK